MPYKPRWTLDIPQCTLPTFLFGSPDEDLLDRPAYIEAERPDRYILTYHTYRLWAKRFAAGLEKAGLQPGERVLLFSGNTIFFPVVIMGVIMAGGIFTGANPSYNARELQYQLENASPKFVITSDAALETATSAAEGAGIPKERVFVFDNGFDTFDERGKDVQGFKHWSNLIASKKEGDKYRWKDDASMTNNTVALNYSSGTTGLPKGVEITHRNYISNSMQQMYLTELRQEFQDHRDDWRWMCFLPMYHAMAQTLFTVGAPYKRVPCYLMRKFEFEKMLENVQKFRITELWLVPPIVVMMTKSPLTKKYDLSSVMGAGCGAAPLGREVVVEFEKIWPEGQVNMKQGYGMTELTCSALGWDPNKHCEDFSVGEPNPNVEAKCVDEKGEEVPRGERGEVWVRGPNVMKGYWHNEKATNETKTSDGWLKTGDVAYVDEQNHFFIVDRMKELIKVKGLQVAPAELEAQLLEHDGVSDVAVVGVTINGDENPRAYIVPAQGQKPDPKEIAKWMESKVSKHKRLTGGVKLVDEIKKNPSGKILRKEYREQASKEVGDSAKKEARM